MNRVVKEFIVSSYQELRSLYLQEQQTQIRLTSARKRNSIVMSIESLLGANKEGSVQSLSKRLDSIQDNIEESVAQFESSVRGILERVDANHTALKNDLVGKIDYLINERSITESTQEKVRYLKNDVKAYIAMQGLRENGYDIYKECLDLSEEVKRFEVKSSLSAVPEPEDLRQYLMNLSRELGQRIVKINHIQTSFEEQLELLESKTDLDVKNAVDMLKEKAKITVESEKSLAM